jgi:hypothetical protein
MDELIKGGFNGEVVVVADEPGYIFRLLKVQSTRCFMVLEGKTKRNVSLSENEVIWKALAEFIKNTKEESPCYIIIDVSAMDAFTLSHLKFVAQEMKKHRSFIETRLMGSVVIVDYDNTDYNYLGPMFRKLYTPIRPMCWWEKHGDALKFVKKWESELE